MFELLKTWQRPTAADLLAHARHRFMAGEPLDLDGLAAELGISRATAYRWAGNGEQLAGRVIASLVDDTFQRVLTEVKGQGAQRVLDVLARGTRYIARFEPLRRYMEKDPERSLRIIASKDGPVQRTAIAHHRRLLEEEIARGNLQLTVDAQSMAYALTRVGESFLYSDLICGEEPQPEKALEIMKLMLQPAPALVRPRHKRAA